MVNLKNFYKCKYCDARFDMVNKSMKSQMEDLLQHVKEKHPEKRHFKLE